MNKKIAKSLRLQLLCAVLLSLLAGVAAYGISLYLGDALLDRSVYGNSFAETMADQHFSQLQEYVTEEEISLNNLQRLNAWCSRGDKVYLTIYKDDTLIYESSYTRKLKNELNVQEYDPDMEDPDSKYTLILHGGVKVRAFLYYYAGDAFYYGLMLLSVLIAAMVFSMCFITVINRKISYIKLLQQELEILAGGQLEYHVTVRGIDELGELALGIDQMRNSIIEHQERENEIRSANSELITAMSHDLRTPLTSLLAYLEIVERKKYTSEEQMHQLIQKSIGQTMRIKTMADQLFEHFFVYATEWENAKMELTDADRLFEQVLEEYAYALESKGMKVDIEFCPVNSQIYVNVELLQRALDNLYSNILKYADSAGTIQIAYRKESKHILLIISNEICSGYEKKESTGIGLNTCRKIISHFGGSFWTEEEEDRFIVTMELPLV